MTLVYLTVRAIYPCLDPFFRMFLGKLSTRPFLNHGSSEDKLGLLGQLDIF